MPFVVTHRINIWKMNGRLNEPKKKKFVSSLHTCSCKAQTQHPKRRFRGNVATLFPSRCRRSDAQNAMKIVRIDHFSTIVPTQVSAADRGMDEPGSA